MAPVFSLVLDRDVNEDLALLYPELYKELTKVRFHHSIKYYTDDPQGRSLSYKTFFTWLTISVYQGQQSEASAYISRFADAIRRRYHHASLPFTFRIRIPSHCGDLFHRFGHQRTYHGCTRDHDLAYIYDPLRTRYSGHLFGVDGVFTSLLWWVARNLRDAC